MKQILLVGLIVLINITLHAQEMPPDLKRCGTDDYQQWLMEKDPMIPQRRATLEKQTQEWLSKHGDQISGKTSGVLATIPVVVHVVYNTSAQNISDAQIISQFDALNKLYRAQNPDINKTPSEWTSLIADMEIEFCLATVDPSGNPTSGITRTQTSRTSFSFNGLNNDPIKLSSQGGKNAWPTDKYMNIWVCNLNSILGYAPMPGDVSTASGMDGVVIHYQGFGTTGNLWTAFNEGKTAAHEIGHWLNLWHPWATGGCANDFVNDTPTQQKAYYQCPPHPSSSCGSVDMTQNVMQWVDDRCMHMFTAGQKARAHAALNGVRKSFLTSTICNTTVVCDPGTKLTTLKEGFEGAFPPSGWKINNNDNAKTWEKTNKAKLQGTYSAYVHNFDYQGKGEIDEMQLPGYDMRGFSNMVLTFNVAYATYSAWSEGFSEELKILVSSDCGKTWTSEYHKKVPELPTDPNPTGDNEFKPNTSSLWRLEKVDLTKYVGKENVSIKFSHINDYENNLYIDEVYLGPMTGIEESLSNYIRVYPNPTKDIFYADISLNKAYKVDIKVYDVIGNLITYIDKSQAVGKVSVDLSGKRAGIYFMEINDGQSVHVERISLVK